jgi:hypothetical protein
MALGIRQGELGALRWLEWDFGNMSISVQHSCYWRRGGSLNEHKSGSVRKTGADASKPETLLAGAESAKRYNKREDFVFPSERLQGIKPLDLALVLKHSVRTMLAEMGEPPLTIGD